MRGGDAPNASQASAQSGGDACETRTGVRHGDGSTGTYDHVWTRDELCPTQARAPVYEHPLAPDGPDAARVATMHSTRTWFVCWTEGRRHAGGNRIWYYTQGDVSDRAFKARHAWGFMPARYVEAEVDPDPGLAPCLREQYVSRDTPRGPAARPLATSRAEVTEVG